MRLQNDIFSTSSLVQFPAKEWRIAKNPQLLLTILFLAIAMLQTGQDFLHSYVNGYTGYLADSLVFKIYWILFIPVLSFLIFHAAEVKKKSRSYPGWLIGIAGTILLSVTHLLVVALLIVMVSHLFFYQPFRFSTPLRYFASEHFYLTLFFYGAGFAFIFYKKQQKRLPATATKAPEFPDFISVSVQNRLIPVPVNEVLYIRADRPYISLHTSKGSYLHAATLKNMHAQLNPLHFVRVHRSVIVNMRQVEHYTSRSNGDYDITMKNGEVVRMSRNYFPEFKKLLA